MRRNIVAAVALLICVSFSRAAEPNPSERAQALIDKGLAYLKAQQEPDFSWQNESDQPAVTAIVLKAFLGNKKYDAQQPFLEKGFAKLLSYQQPNGGIYKDALANYNTAIAITALSEAKGDKYRPRIDQAIAFIKKLQWNNNPEELAERKPVD